MKILRRNTLRKYRGNFEEEEKEILIDDRSRLSFRKTFRTSHSSFEPKTIIFFSINEKRKKEEKHLCGRLKRVCTCYMQKCSLINKPVYRVNHNDG